jgi:hypothetical protein
MAGVVWWMEWTMRRKQISHSKGPIVEPCPGPNRKNAKEF